MRTSVFADSGCGRVGWSAYQPPAHTCAVLPPPICAVCSSGAGVGGAEFAGEKGWEKGSSWKGAEVRDTVWAVTSLLDAKGGASISLE